MMRRRMTPSCQPASRCAPPASRLLLRTPAAVRYRLHSAKNGDGNETLDALSNDGSASNECLDDNTAGTPPEVKAGCDSSCSLLDFPSNVPLAPQLRVADALTRASDTSSHRTGRQFGQALRGTVAHGHDTEVAQWVLVEELPDEPLQHPYAHAQPP